MTNQINDHSISIEEKLGAVKTYREHLHEQYIDRSIQWALNELSTETDSNTLTILVDGMDQAKFRLPRHPHHRAIASMLPFEHVACFAISFCYDPQQPRKYVGPKTNQYSVHEFVFLVWPSSSNLRAKVQRPCMKLHAAWAVGR